MAESTSHKTIKNQAAGLLGKTEVPLGGGRRLDALTSRGTATEVERGGSTARLEAAVERLKDSGAPRKVLQVPHTDIPKAIDAMKDARVAGTVKNLGGTKSVQVSKKR